MRLHTFKKFPAALLIIALSALPFAGAAPAHAAVASWLRGADVVPASTTDFASASFQQSLRDLKATGANYVDLIVPYYQSNIYSTDVGPGWNTPTDSALASAIDYAHSIGLSVALNMHVDPYDGNWRANINPSDRAGWFQNYGRYLVHIAGIGQAHNAELIVIGSELVDMAAYTQNGSNTSNWQSLIGQVRNIYSGKLTYDANSDNNTSGGPFQDEKDYIGFWGGLDYAGLSAYYNLNSDNQVSSLEGQWDYWNNSDLKGFASRVGKPILFVEVGYRSVDNAHAQPWNWQMGGSPNMTEQSNDYQALFAYWNNYDYIAGAFMWNWDTNPNAGGTGSTDYTPQNKPAEGVMKQWFSSAGAPSNPPSSGSVSFTASGSANPENPAAGSAAALGATVKNMGSTLSGGLVDMEVYDANGSRVFQKFWDNQNIAANGSQSYSASWTPNASGAYRMAIGIFSGDWSKNYYWNSSAAAISVGSAAINPPPSNNPPPATNPPPSGSPGPLDVWWPTDGAHVSGVQPFKAMVENIDTGKYRMFWAVGNGQWNEMSDSSTDYPHKEALVDLSGWSWSGAGPYSVNFIATQTDGSTVITKKAINIWTQ